MNRIIKTDKYRLHYNKQIEGLMNNECNKLFIIYKLKILLNKKLISQKEYEFLIKKYI